MGINVDSTPSKLDWASLTKGELIVAKHTDEHGQTVTREGKITTKDGLLWLGPNQIASLITDGYELVSRKQPEPPMWGERARAKCSATGLSMGWRGGKPPLVLFVSAMDNDFCIDEWDPDGEPSATLPVPTRRELAAASTALRHTGGEG